jgi:short-subunit dehydrogenase
MMRVFITGSSDGIGLHGARVIADRGHEVYLHARNQKRADDAKKGCPKAAGVLIGDLSSIQAMKDLAKEANKNGPFDCVVHNAGYISWTH